MDVTVRIQDHYAFQMIKYAMVELQNTLEDISPQVLNALIVNAPSSNDAPSARSLTWVLQHVQCNLGILPSFVTSNTRWKAIPSHSCVESTENSGCCVISSTVDNDNET